MGVNGIYGLSGSGLDVESMVKAAMKGRQSNYDKMYKKEVKQEWVKSAYNDFYNSLTTYKYTTLSNYKMQSTMNAMKATSSNTAVATVTANGEAASMSHNIKVTSLTTNAYLQTTSAGITRDNTSSNKSIYLKDIIQSSIGSSSTPGIASYDSNADTVTLNDSTVIQNASTTAALTFKIKDAASSSTTTRYTTTTTDASGNTISGFVPQTNGTVSTYTTADGKKYDTVTTDETATGKIQTDLYLTTDSSGNTVSGFYSTASAASGTYTSGSKTYNTTSTTATDGTITTTLINNADSTDTLTYTTSKKLTYTTNTLNSDTGVQVALYRPAENGTTSSAAEGSTIVTDNYTTTTTDGTNTIKGFIPQAAGTGTTTLNGVTYTTTTTDNSDGTITTSLVNGGTTLTYTTTTTNSSGTVQKAFRPDSTATQDSSGNLVTTESTTTTTTAINSDGSVGTTIAANALSDGSTVSYTYKDLYEKTLNDLVSDIGKANGNITATYDSVNDSISIYNKNGGSANMAAISAYTGSYTNSAGKTVAGATSTTMTNALFNHLHLGMYDGTTLNSAQTLSDTSPLSAVGSSGSITVDGKTYSNLTTGKVTVAGVSYTLVATGSSSVSVSQDTDTIVKNVKQFVDDYNKILDSLNTKIYETNYVSGSTSNTSYDPLTDAEKKGMSNDEVTSWEAKAKTGLLYHSTVLRNIVSSMRSALSTPVDAVSSDYKTLGSIGISTSTDQGHIQLDEDQLKKALAADPDSVYQLFASSPDSDTDTDNMGVANRLDVAMKNGLSAISDEAGTSTTTIDQSVLGKSIISMKEKMKDYQTMMDDYQTKLYKQYDAMETAIAKLNSQNSYISQAFG